MNSYTQYHSMARGPSVACSVPAEFSQLRLSAELPARPTKNTCRLCVGFVQEARDEFEAQLRYCPNALHALSVDVTKCPMSGPLARARACSWTCSLPLLASYPQSSDSCMS